ncbi:type I pullulanase [Evansella tamaricis]|uniref:Type I pullulanase n=1 Tax=Evansella tamaricis TaxID=2069301 RepID=A0ABS6JJE5_9BACI|nr:type I pullulanase [Evansella tamaricis]MBU9713804.1 type I pullulanase [Evansella tamaricis]
MEQNVAWIDHSHELTINMKDKDILDELDKNGSVPSIALKDKVIFPQVNSVIDFTVKMSVDNPLPLGEELILTWGEWNIPVFTGAVVRTKWFDETYSATEAVLGPSFGKDGTLFSLWAPTATSVIISLNNKLYSLNRSEKGVWSTYIEGNWHGAVYEFEITINGKVEWVIDPYAKGLLANSEKGVVIDPEKTVPFHGKRIDRPKIDSLFDTIIYELHVRDATVSQSSGVHNKGTFLGLTETNTMTSGGFSTGLSYIKELGITHVQLLPINDFARVDELKPENQYNWGYDPLFFQVPEGSYSTIPNNPVSRIKECKQMIDAFHEEGISVILDVVFNHVFIMEESPFEKIVPGYYFRYHEDGTVSNGTGVGNDFASERIMGRKFILDTVKYWLHEYKVDGFRFDLMGALDVFTMEEIRDFCSKEEDPVMLLGEGWELPTALPSQQKATIFHSDQLHGISYFNDFFRDTLKGNLFDGNDRGFVNGNGRFVERLSRLLTGSVLEEFGQPMVDDVKQSINYVECHDNHTLWDKLTLSNSQDEELVRKKMHRMATGLTLLSQGIPFLHAGQEWFRSKNGDDNSYISGDEVNQLDWEQREKEHESIAFIRALIKLRKENSVFRLKTKEEIRRRFHLLHVPDPILGFTLIGDHEDFAIYGNPMNRKQDIHLPSPGIWQVVLSSDLEGWMNYIKGEFAELQPYELVVMKKTRK